MSLGRMGKAAHITFLHLEGSEQMAIQSSLLMLHGGEDSPRDAAAALIKRLAHRNANVQLYTLELANALSQNCGPKMHRELASRSFTDALLRLASDRVRTFRTTRIQRF